MIGRCHALVKPEARALLPAMIKREDSLVLGLTAGVTGSLVGGLLLGLGMSAVAQGVHMGWLLVLPAAPVGGLLGYVLARKLAKRL